MDLMSIAKRSGIQPRRLRYVVYHLLVPGIERAAVGKGSVRHFTAFEAFGLAFSATLLDAGLSRQFASEVLAALVRSLSRQQPVSQIPLYRAFASRGDVHVDVADRRHARVRGRDSLNRELPAAWIPLDAEAPGQSADFQPTILLTVNLSSLRDAIKAQDNPRE
jgi:hypothetical protein